jgi:hypothetical protein
VALPRLPPRLATRNRKTFLVPQLYIQVGDEAGFFDLEVLEVILSRTIAARSTPAKIWR